MEIVKKYKIFLLSIICLLILLAFSFCQYYKMYNSDIERFQQISEKCKIDSSLEICTDNIKPMHYDTLTMFYDIFTIESLSWIQLIGCIFVIVPAIWQFHKKQKNGFFKNCLLRENYETYLKKEFKHAYMAIFLLPLLALLGLIICYVVSGFNIDHTFITKYYGSYLSTFDSKYLSMGILFPLLYILNLFFHSMFYVNLGLISCKKNKNIFVTILIAFLLFVGINILSDVIIENIIFENILRIHNVSGFLNLLNIWAYSETSLVLMLSLGFVLALGSFMALLIMYKNKEEVIMESEK